MKPTLFHINISHYSEKVRWALDFKRVPHTRLAPAPGIHPPVALWLTRGKHATLPVLRIDGRAVGDSTAIIQALEERFPERPLLPADGAERAEALRIEDWLDEEVGPRVRRVGFNAFRKDAERFAEVGRLSAPLLFEKLGPFAAAYAKAFTALRYGAHDDAAVEQAKEQLPGLLDRLEEERGGREYLVGDRFGVADLTAAALLYPLVRPPQLPLSQVSLPPALEEYFDEVGGHGAIRWARVIFEKHR